MGKPPQSPPKRTARRLAPAAAPPPAVIGTQARFPGFIEPALATLVSKPPVGPRWRHEIKFDGYRLQARVRAGKVSFLTRSGLDWTARFGRALADAVRALPAVEAIMDGELVVEDLAGRSDFGLLQGALKAGDTGPLRLYLFDLVYIDGRDLRGAPLSARQDRLKELLGDARGPVRFSEAFDDPGAIVLQHACRLSLEGIVSKAIDEPYRSGRTGIWLKSKCSSRQELVIAGYVPSTASSTAIGSLVLGAYEGGQFRHIGRVGTGYTERVARELYQALEIRRVDRSPFAQPLDGASARDVRFVRPELVAEIEFRGWSRDGLLRHASYRGLREDKVAGEVTIERPA
jgi:bifunctional non-homologous end joining protein LigD